MVLIVVVLVVATLIALIRGGKLRNVIDVQLPLWWLLLIALVVQLTALYLLPDEEWTASTALALILTSFFLMVIVVLVNRRRSGMWLAGVGILMNFTVIALNGGMPVSTEAAAIAAGLDSLEVVVNDFKHVELLATSRLPALADVIPLRLLGISQVISLGDVLLAVGVGQFVESELRRPIRWFKHGPQSAAGSAAS